MKFGKISDGVFEYAPRLLDNIANPKDSMYIAKGYMEVVDVVPETDSEHYAVATEWKIEDGKIVRVYKIKEVEKTPRAFSKFRLIVKLKSEGLYETFKAALKAADLEDEWIATTVLDEGYPLFPGYLEQARVALGITPEKLEEILADSIEQ